MKTYRFHLAPEPFNAIKNGSKTIESRLYDEKRQQIQLDDELIFANREARNQTVTAKVIGLLRYPTFHEMFSHNDPAKFGGESVKWLESQVGEFYSAQDQHTNGVLGIEFCLIRKTK